MKFNVYRAGFIGLNGVIIWFVGWIIYHEQKVWMFYNVDVYRNYLSLLIFMFIAVSWAFLVFERELSEPAEVNITSKVNIPSSESPKHPDSPEPEEHEAFPTVPEWQEAKE